MTIETEDYTTKALMKTGKATRHSNDWRPLHTDLINNDESQGYHVTYVNGIDDPDRTPEAIAKRLEQKTKNERVDILKTKLKNRTISQPELLELLESLL